MGKHKTRFILSFVILTLLTGQLKAQKVSSITTEARIKFTIKSSKQDTIGMYIWDEFSAFETRNFHYTRKIEKVRDFDRVFRFKFELVKPVYMTIYKKYGGTLDWELMTLYLIEPGDDITAEIKLGPIKKEPTADFSSRTFGTIDTMIFAGAGSAKYICKFLLENSIKNAKKNFLVGRKINEKYALPANSSVTDTRYFLTDLRRSVAKKTYEYSGAEKLLVRFKKRISPFVFKLMTADLYGSKNWLFYKNLYALSTMYSIPSFPDLTKDTLQKFFQYYQTHPSFKEPALPVEVLSKSAYYSHTLIRRQLFESAIFNKSFDDLMFSFTNGLLRERLITEHLVDDWSHIKNAESKLDSALTIVKNLNYLKQLINLKEAQSVGKQAYNFTLLNVDDKPVSLIDFKNKVVFIDFWYTGCGSCSNYYKDVLAKVEDKFRNNSEVVFITICIDKVKSQWLNSINSGSYTSELAINLTTGSLGSQSEVIKRFGVYEYPRPLLIGKNGNVFNNSNLDLRMSGVVGLVDIINKALHN